MGRLKLSSSIILAFILLIFSIAEGKEYSGPIYRQGINDIAVLDDYAYCAASDGLEILDIDNTSMITRVGSIPVAEGAAAISIRGNYVYLAAWDSGVRIIDISNPRKPSLKADFTIPGYACDIVLSDHYAYIAYGYSGLQIIDIADPLKPEKVGSFDNSGFAFRVMVDGEYAFVHDLNNGILIINIENPANPVLIDTYNVESGISDFAAAENHLYIAQRNDGLLVIDYSDIDNLRQVGSMAYSNIGNLAMADGFLLFAGGVGNSEIGITDISSPGNPKLLGTLNTQTWNKRITVIGNSAYVAGFSGFSIIDISNSSNPSIEAIYTPYPRIKRPYGIDPYIKMPGETGQSTMDYNQDGRDMVLQAPDVYVAGRAGELDAWHVFFSKADTSGTELWVRDYGPWTLYDGAFALTATNDNQFVLGGKSQDVQGRTNDDIMILKVNANGDSVWHHQYDLDGVAYDGNGFDRLWDIVELDNGDLIGCGTITARNFPIDPLILPESHKDAGFIKFNALGEIYWVQYYGSTTSTETARACIATSDNNLAFTGYSDFQYNGKNHLYVVKTDMNGDVIWQRSHGDLDKWHIANWMEEADDGNYVIAGEIETVRGIDGLAMKVSSDNGDIIWQRSFGEQYTDAFIDGLITGAGDILLAGYKTLDTLGTRIPWLLKLDSAGTYICEIEDAAEDSIEYYFGLRGPLASDYILGGNSLDPYDVYISSSDLSGCETLLYSYLPGDANMAVGQWPPLVIGGDVTYMVGYFRDLNQACLMGSPALFCAGDANGDCQVIGSDVTKMVTYFRGLTQLSYCPDYPPRWLTPSDCPEQMPSGWPGCE